MKSFEDIQSREISSMHFIGDYCRSLYSQRGIKAFIKKRIFGNLLNVLLFQENKINELVDIVNEQNRVIRSLENNQTIHSNNSIEFMVDSNFVERLNSYRHE